VRRLGIRAAIVALILAAAVAARVATLPQPPVPREILAGGAAITVTFFAIIGGFAILEARALSRAEERMRRFLADASHELRTPISGAHASAETLLRTDPGRAAREELVLRILHETHRAGRLVNDLLAMTRLEQGIPLDRTQFDLVPLAAAAVEQTRELAPALKIHLHAPARCSLVGDPLRITQILDNLLANARHATPGGGRIDVRIARRATYVDLEVVDSGPGVPPADRERIFERFTRLADAHPSRPDGNGLGLAIARSIATAHKGTLTCAGPAGPAGPAGHGALFLLRLPGPH
jgi:two-component system OmpR family sensor kinase